MVSIVDSLPAGIRLGKKLLDLYGVKERQACIKFVPHGTIFRASG